MWLNPFTLLARLLGRLLADVIPRGEGAADGHAEVIPFEPRRGPVPSDAQRLEGGRVPLGGRGLEVSRRLGHEPAAVTEARRALEPLGQVVDRRAFDDTRLLVSELVTNSVRHASPHRPSHIELSVAAAPPRVRVEVSDGGAGFEPAGRTKGDEEGSGWGLHLVEQLSSRWGVDRNARTLVWFELEASFEPDWRSRAGPSEVPRHSPSEAPPTSAKRTGGPLRRVASLVFLPGWRELEHDVD